MNVTIAYDQNQDLQPGSWLRRNLTDMAVSLDIRLRRHHHASSKASFLPGKVDIEIQGADQSVVKPLMDAFQEAMTRNGFSLMITHTD